MTDNARNYTISRAFQQAIVGIEPTGRAEQNAAEQTAANAVSTAIKREVLVSALRPLDFGRSIATR
jgi:hypothetical protein